MPAFDQASHFIINEATFVETTAESASQYLCKHVASGASHNSKDQYEQPKCHPDTRRTLLDDIHEWIKLTDKETGIMYLHGPAGAGKSCIARSVCERAAKEGLLGASFFFWRGSSSRNNETRLITTLAYQLAESNAELKEHISSEVERNPRIVDMPLGVQFQKLISEPCSKVPHERLYVRAMVIDGLDECMGEGMQVAILEMLSMAVRKEGFPLGFLITSRPELHIQEALDSKDVIFATNVISLNRIPGVSDDIRTVLQSGFIGILNNPRFRRAMKSVSRPWPAPESIEKLVRRSSGQFIYSSTVLKFISDTDRNPATQLEIVLGVRDVEGSSPLDNLDLLYEEIMSRVKDPKLTLRVLSYVLAIKHLGKAKIPATLIFFTDITRAVLHNQNRLLLVIEQLLGLSDGMAYFALNQLHSLLSLKVGSESTRRRLEIDFYHKSFEDYLTTKKRSKALYVSLKNAHIELAESCLKFMGLPIYETESQHVGWLYSCFQWSVHSKFGGNVCIVSSHDEALQRFTSRWTYYLSMPHLDRALHNLGLFNNYKWLKLRNDIQNFGSISVEDLVRTVKEGRLSLGFEHGNRPKEPNQLKLFNKLYAYPVWRKILQSYNDSAWSTKLFILVHRLTAAGYMLHEIPDESETCTILSELGLIPDDVERHSVMSQYKEVAFQVDSLMDRWELEKFIMSAESTDPLHCASVIVSNVYAAIISSGIWRNHNAVISLIWRDKAEVMATDALLACLKSEALDFHNDLELNQKLGIFVEDHFFSWLRNNLQGPTKEVIEAWERAFAKAHCLFPDNFISENKLTTAPSESWSRFSNLLKPADVPASRWTLSETFGIYKRR